MARWGVTASKGAGNVQGVMYAVAAAASMRRAKLYDWTLGCGASPADNAFIHVVQRATSASLVGAAKTPNALDQADTLASTIVVTDTVTTDGTLTAGAFVLRKALNQRATFRWVAAPYGELFIPATANTGFMLGLSAASTTSFDYDLNYEEY
jgi:hypothetical protein